MKELAFRNNPGIRVGMTGTYGIAEHYRKVACSGQSPSQVNWNKRPSKNFRRALARRLSPLIDIPRRALRHALMSPTGRIATHLVLVPTSSRIQSLSGRWVMGGKHQHATDYFCTLSSAAG